MYCIPSRPLLSEKLITRSPLNDEDNTDSAALLPWIEQALQDVRDLRHLQLLQQARTD